MRRVLLLFGYSAVICSILSLIMAFRLQEDHHEHKDGGKGHEIPPPPEKIEWSAKRKLTWADYKGSWNNTRKNPVMTFVSTFYTHFASKTGDTILVETVPIFYPADSYVKAENKTKEQLFFEQTKFDLYEVWARKLRKDFSIFNFQKSNYSTYMQSMYKANLQARNLELAKFMNETGSGTIPAKITEWSVKINKQLADLQKYQKKSIAIYPK